MCEDIVECRKLLIFSFAWMLNSSHQYCSCLCNTSQCAPSSMVAFNTKSSEERVVFNENARPAEGLVANILVPGIRGHPVRPSVSMCVLSELWQGWARFTLWQPGCPAVKLYCPLKVTAAAQTPRASTRVWSICACMCPDCLSKHEALCRQTKGMGWAAGAGPGYQGEEEEETSDDARCEAWRGTTTGQRQEINTYSYEPTHRHAG